MRVDGGPQIGLVDGVALRRRRQIRDCLGERGVALRHADEVACLLGRDGHRQPLRVGVADVLGREPDQAPGDVQRILAGLEHPREPVHRGVRVAVAHGLVKGGDQVVVLFARLVVQECPALDRLLEERRVDLRHAVHRRCRRGGELEQVEGHAPVAVRVPCDAQHGLLGDSERQAAESLLAVRERAPQDRRRVGFGERLQHEHLRSREQGRVDLERRVLRRRADEDDVARLDPRQEGVLLGLVEPVNLVDEEDGAAAPGTPRTLGPGHHLADFLDAGQHRREGDELRLGRLGNQPGEAGLARARRPPEDDRLQQIAFDGLAQRLPRRQQVLLAHVFVERPRAHPLGERHAAAVGLAAGLVEQVGVRHDRAPACRCRYAS